MVNNQERDQMPELPYDFYEIVDGKRYDTEVSKMIGYQRDGRKDDFRFIEEGLFMTPKSKRYFLAGRGGASTRYARHGHGGSFEGEGVIPLSRKEAFEWAQRHLDTYEVEEHFGDMIEDA